MWESFVEDVTAASGNSVLQEVSEKHQMLSGCCLLRDEAMICEGVASLTVFKFCSAKLRIPKWRKLHPRPPSRVQGQGGIQGLEQDEKLSVCDPTNGSLLFGELPTDYTS